MTLGTIFFDEETCISVTLEKLDLMTNEKTFNP